MSKPNEQQENDFQTLFEDIVISFFDLPTFREQLKSFNSFREKIEYFDYIQLELDEILMKDIYSDITDYSKYLDFFLNVNQCDSFLNKLNEIVVKKEINRSILALWEIPDYIELTHIIKKFENCLDNLKAKFKDEKIETEKRIYPMTHFLKHLNMNLENKTIPEQISWLSWYKRILETQKIVYEGNFQGQVIEGKFYEFDIDKSIELIQKIKENLEAENSDITGKELKFFKKIENGKFQILGKGLLKQFAKILCEKKGYNSESIITDMKNEGKFDFTTKNINSLKTYVKDKETLKECQIKKDFESELLSLLEIE